MIRASVALHALNRALDHVVPECSGDERFTDDLTNEDHVRELCVLCPVYGLCLAYAVTQKPTGGIWAGRRWDTTTKEKAK